MLALLPVRALAAVTTGFCSFGHQQGAAAEHDAGTDHAPAHSHDSSGCSSCVEHCSSAAFAVAAWTAMDVPAPTDERSALHDRAPPGFIPDHLDPPPLAG